MAQVAHAWLRAQAVVPIPGMRRRERVTENAGAADLELTTADLEQLTDALPAEEISGDRDVVTVAEGTDR